MDYRILTNNEKCIVQKRLTSFFISKGVSYYREPMSVSDQILNFGFGLEHSLVEVDFNENTISIVDCNNNVAFYVMLSYSRAMGNEKHMENFINFLKKETESEGGY